MIILAFKIAATIGIFSAPILWFGAYKMFAGRYALTLIPIAVSLAIFAACGLSLLWGLT